MLLEAHLKNVLSRYPQARNCWVAYSGGVDSHVLLHALTRIRSTLTPELHAIHINHGLSAHADHWENHCRRTCASYSVDFLSFPVEIPAKTGVGVEAYARAERYKIFAGLIKRGDVLLTAHHGDDQVETMLLRLLRGAGPDGLAGMQPYRAFAGGVLLRPLLDCLKSDLHEYATRAALHWIEDDSNQSHRYDRNYLRSAVLPLLLSRWPGAMKGLRRVVEHQAESRRLLDEIAKSDLDGISQRDKKSIRLVQLAGLPRARRINTLRAWLKSNDALMPNARVTNELDAQLMKAAKAGGGSRCIEWRSAAIRTYRGCAYLTEPVRAYDRRIAGSRAVSWDFKEPLVLEHGHLSANATVGAGLKKSVAHGVEVRTRKGGETIRLWPGTHRRQLKKLFQEAGILPWLRNCIPLLFYDDELIAVGDLWSAGEYTAADNEPGWQLTWRWRDGT